MFVDKTLVPISDGTNTIYILPRWTVGIRARVIGAALQTGTDGTATVNGGAFQVELLKCLIKRWEGPAFAHIPLTPENIEALDPDEDLVSRTVDACMAATRSPQETDPNLTPSASTTDGAAGSEVITLTRQDSGTFTSS